MGETPPGANSAESQNAFWHTALVKDHLLHSASSVVALRAKAKAYDRGAIRIRNFSPLVAHENAPFVAIIGSPMHTTHGAVQGYAWKGLL